MLPLFAIQSNRIFILCFSLILNALNFKRRCKGLEKRKRDERKNGEALYTTFIFWGLQGYINKRRL